MFRDARKKQLQDLIDSILIKNKEAGTETQNYYQGFNDISSVFLLTLEENLAFYCTDIASRFLFNDFL